MTVYELVSPTGEIIDQYERLTTIAAYLKAPYASVWRAANKGAKVKDYTINTAEIWVHCERKFSKEQLETRRKHSKYATNNLKIQQWSKDGTLLVGEYATIAEAERHTMISQFNISQCLRGKAKSAGSYTWKVVPQSDPNDQE